MLDTLMHSQLQLISASPGQHVRSIVKRGVLRKWPNPKHAGWHNSFVANVRFFKVNQSLLGVLQALEIDSQ